MRSLRETLAVALLATSGCEVADFDVVREGTATIPRGTIGDDFHMMEIDDELVLAEIQDEHDVGREDVADAEITRFTLEVFDPAGIDFAFAHRIEVFAEAPGLESVRIAHQDRFPAGARIIELETDDVDLRDYVAAPTVTLVARVDGVAPPADVRLKGRADLHLGVTLRGACDHM